MKKTDSERLPQEMRERLMTAVQVHGTEIVAKRVGCVKNALYNGMEGLQIPKQFSRRIPGVLAGLEKQLVLPNTVAK